MNSFSPQVAAAILFVATIVTLTMFMAFVAGTLLGPKRKRRSILACSSLALALLIQAMMWSGYVTSFNATTQHPTDLARIGVATPTFKLTDCDGNDFDIKAERGKVVLVNFFATWCGPCLKELPHLDTLWRKHQGNADFSLIVIGREETTELLREFRWKNGYDFRIGADPNGRIFSLFATEKIPRTYLIAKDGTVCFAATGFLKNNFGTLEKVLVKQLK